VEDFEFVLRQVLRDARFQIWCLDGRISLIRERKKREFWSLEFGGRRRFCLWGMGERDLMFSVLVMCEIGLMRGLGFRGVSSELSLKVGLM